jgi:LPXTG-motif cell wall-anchored protein
MRLHKQQWRLWLIAVVMGSGLFFSLRPCTAFACSCLQPGTPTNELNQSSAVFAGKVVAIDTPSSLPTLTTSFPFIVFQSSSADPVSVIFDVSDVWKGPAYRRLVVMTPRESASCRFAFQIGESYLVYATEQGAELTTNLCSRTSSLSQAQPDLVALGPGTAPTLDGVPQPSPSNSLLLALGGVSILLAGLAVLFLVRKRRSI